MLALSVPLSLSAALSILDPFATEAARQAWVTNNAGRLLARYTCPNCTESFRATEGYAEDGDCALCHRGNVEMGCNGACPCSICDPWDTARECEQCEQYTHDAVPSPLDASESVCPDCGAAQARWLREDPEGWREWSTMLDAATAH